MAKQVVKTSEARDVLFKDSRSKEARGGGGRKGGESCRVYRASVGVWSADLQMLKRRALVGGRGGSAQQQGDAAWLRWEQ